jgi:hypothetical protein
MATEDDVRELALSLPETSERPSYGSPGFRVKGTLFARLRNEAEGGLLVHVAGLDEKETLLAADPAKFFTTPHYDGYASVIVRLEAIDRTELSEVITDAWIARAPVRVRQAHAVELGLDPS